MDRRLSEEFQIPEDEESQRLSEESLAEKIKLVEKHILNWIEDSEAWLALWNLYRQGQEEFGYEFLIRKRVLKRVWGCISTAVRKADERVHSESSSH
jgi:hypothetical protein